MEFACRTRESYVGLQSSVDTKTCLPSGAKTEPVNKNKVTTSLIINPFRMGGIANPVSPTNRFVRRIDSQRTACGSGPRELIAALVFGITGMAADPVEGNAMAVAQLEHLGPQIRV